MNTSPRSRRRSRLAVVTGTALAFGLLLGAGVPAAMAQPVDPRADLPVPTASPGEVRDQASASVPEGDRGAIFGSGDAASDSGFTLVGDSTGVNLMRGEGGDGFAWNTIAHLSVDGVEADHWVGNYCLTEDASHAGVVYGPRALTNDEQSFNQGAWGAVVDTTTGEVHPLGRGYSLAYFNPGCGAGDAVTFTRFDGGQTYLGTADAVTGTPVLNVAVPGQLTSALPAADGSVYAASGTGIVRADATGTMSPVVATTGQAYGLIIDGGGGLSYLERKGETAKARHLVPGGKPTTMASGGVTDLGLTRDGQGNAFVLGSAAAKATGLPARVMKAPRLSVDADLSILGTIGVEAVASSGHGATGDAGTEEALVTAQDVSTAKSFTLAARLDQSRAVAGQQSAAVGPEASQRSAAATGSKTNPSESERTCAIPRNDIKWQAYQPMPRQVEWAVNRAVRGELTEQRPANWRGYGMAAYTPQSLFPRRALTGGGTIPDQVLLGVLMQESNLWQASRYTSPGLTGNPLIGSYYGISHDAGARDDAFWTVALDSADCGYGIGQITDGMRLSSKSPADNPALPTVQQQAIAIDYQANIARAQQMLADKWNQLQAKGITINDNDPSKIENWFGAVWIYNTGYAGPDAKGYEGLGWLNNPANSIYPANRMPFLDGRPADASHPQDWPYGEKVMGFAAHSQGLVERQTAEGGRVEVAGYRVASWNGGEVEGPRNRAFVKPPLNTFCTPAVNACTNGTTQGVCTRADLHCWYKANATWKKDCSTTCGVGFYRFTPASSYMTEASASVGKASSFPPACTRTGLPSGALIVDDVPMTADGVKVSNAPVTPSCSAAVSTTGSFGFDFGQPRNGSYPSKIDTHQIGAGFNGHFWFSHTRGPQDTLPSTVTGSWNLGQSLAGRWTRVYVHTPDHAGWTQQAAYQVDKGDGAKIVRTLPQRTYQNEWRSLGVFQMTGIPKVTLSNVTADGADWLDDIAWDAVAFEPLSAKPRDFVVSMGDSFSSGEGAPSPTGRRYLAETDNNASDADFRNACHRSREAWSRKATLGTSPMTIGARADGSDATMDFHQISCSGAVTENIRSANPGALGLPDGGQSAGLGQWGERTQIDQGYLNADTTLVTLTVGGNDIGFKDVLTTCLAVNLVSNVPCKSTPMLFGMTLETKTHLAADQAVAKIDLVLAQIQQLAPNAKIVILGYPPIFQDGVSCVGIGTGDNTWLNEMGVHLNQSVLAAARNRSSAAHPVFYADPAKEFAGRNACSSNPAINGLIAITTTDNRGLPWNGDKPVIDVPNFTFGVSQQSVHPNYDGTTLYSKTMERALAGPRL